MTFSHNCTDNKPDELVYLDDVKWADDSIAIHLRSSNGVAP